ncbi:secretion system protein [Bordetella pertussis]|uniref:Type IV secretion system protein PtlI n=9 Tax=Bordetella TaxID=517 RepID=PTLI_BORPE|nr:MULTISPECIES: type IV secretion system protein PtlI [Bordetella]Q7VSX7.1 RecName: Full=Type IV secretion system protein PtlI; AltName: Full=Pertussis toxin liberation protein I; Flags: Precursor [Bordetella pertussis Tohama I]Q7W2U1.1 RecName: Full=Type IV secretion system protein PtlI homolog; Flags: Precursor [Bordetella parapertussis 12822]ETH39371.1 type IV secretion system protein PtlI [Bordetella pertussis H918]ETH48991.1 type IV secretion system protein PtlI [Bordetella pertussis H921
MIHAHSNARLLRWAILAIAPVTLGACAPNGPPGLPYPDGKPLIPINTAAPEQGSSCQTRAP